MLLAANTHIGTKNLTKPMESYVYKQRDDGIHVINVLKTWEKIVFAARVIVAIENPQDVVVISARPYGQRAALKFSHYTGCRAIAGRFTPGTFTNYITRAFREPRLIIVTDPRTDHQPVVEAAYVNIPVIALCDSDSLLQYVDIAIPGNNKGAHSLGLLYWMLAREVLRLRGSISRTSNWEVMVDMFFYRDAEAEKEQEAAAQAAAADQPVKEVEWDEADPSWEATNDYGAQSSLPSVPQGQDWGASANADWGAEVAAAPVVDAAAPGAAVDAGWAQAPAQQGAW